MRFLEIFSKNIFRLVAGGSLQKIRTNSIETVLAKSVRMIDQDTLSEMQAFVRTRQTSEGGFADRGGKCDLYYSLFGCYIAQALGVHELMPSLREYVNNRVRAGNLEGIHLKCAVILLSKLFGPETVPSALKKGDKLQPLYSDFINLLAYYYTEDYQALFRIRRKLKISNRGSEMPCSVIAAHLILEDCSGGAVTKPGKQLNDFYRNDGSFAALRRAPTGDLLSTGVALYALKFINSEIRIIKPDCLIYIDSLYSEGGFCATASDPGPDVEYTFYGLLALGALSD
ncbi:MAG: hypothetical protein A2X05_08400 [Bacteroidetes bacterium GWE2_41_25]|nr:MAG: hypothetical protein A2X05_08400 [Bacteroidetes bacterium GWE2_41_25]OFY57645.1 MAG: hypothetical protein A2X04_16935 [Bacteroidetes bacterium GWF2_41_9]HAM08909.1 hypothetical protein [Bacteroidales bacterium]